MKTYTRKTEQKKVLKPILWKLLGAHVDFIYRIHVLLLKILNGENKQTVFEQQFFLCNFNAELYKYVFRLIWWETVMMIFAMDADSFS